MKIAIMGTGGLGGYFGAQLARAGQEVTFIARGEMLGAMRDNGLQVDSPLGDFKIDPVRVTGNSSEIGPVDLVLCCVKNYHLDTAIEGMKPLIGPDTLVLPLLNGIEHIEKLRTALGPDHVLGGLAVISVHKGEPGTIRHVGNPAGAQYQIEFGEWGQPISDRCMLVERIWDNTGVGVKAIDNIEERMWQKLAFISSTSVFAVARGNKGTVWIPEIRAISRQILAETVAVANARQVAMPENYPDDRVSAMDLTPSAFKPSLLVDLEKGNRLEVEAMNGYISRLGKELHIDTPANDFVYACLKPHVEGSAQAS